MLRLALIVSLLSHLAWGAALYRYSEAYDSLLTWACANGNGGHECGEQ